MKRQVVFEEWTTKSTGERVLARAGYKRADLDLEYALFGSAPVQATGSLKNRDIYFHARHQQWTFEVESETGELPSDGYAGGMQWEGHHPEASFMPFGEACSVIEDCAGQYLNEDE